MIWYLPFGGFLLFIILVILPTLYGFSIIRHWHESKGYVDTDQKLLAAALLTPMAIFIGVVIAYLVGLTIAL